MVEHSANRPMGIFTYRDARPHLKKKFIYIHYFFNFLGGQYLVIDGNIGSCKSTVIGHLTALDQSQKIVTFQGK